MSTYIDTMLVCGEIEAAERRIAATLTKKSVELHDRSARKYEALVCSIFCVLYFYRIPVMGQVLDSAHLYLGQEGPFTFLGVQLPFDFIIQITNV